MNRLMLGLLLYLVTGTALFAASDGTPDPTDDIHLVGHVLDKRTHQHLPGVRVAIRGTTLITATDKSGHYFLKNLPEGRFTLEYKTLGYRTATREVTFVKGGMVEANVELEASEVSLDGVVVSANRAETSRRLAPTLINVLDHKIFATTHSLNLAQGLNFQPGVRVEDKCQNCGYQQVRINGLDGPYTQMLIDSRPLFSALASVYALEQIPANMIERVEIMRGGGSALFGSSAIAGTINIITKEPLRNSGLISHNLTSLGGSSSYDNNTALNASLVTDNGNAGIYLFGQNRHRSGYDHDGDGFTELPQLENQTVGFRSYIRTSNYSKLTLEYHHMNEYRRGGDHLDLPTSKAEIAEELHHSIDGGELKFDIFTPDYRNRWSLYTSAQSIQRKNYYGADHDEDAYGKSDNQTFLVGSQYIHSFDRCLFMPADLTAGLEYNYDHLNDEMPGYDRYTEQKIHVESAFLQNEWKTGQWSVLLGGRLDKHNLIDHVIFSPRANLRYNPIEKVNLRVSYSGGFRAPQAYDDDMHISAVGGKVAITHHSKNLKEEKSHSLSGSVDFYHRFGNGIQLNLLAEGFFTDLSDVFILADVGTDAEGNTLRERRNGSGAQVMGLTFEGKAAFTSWLSLQAGATFQKSRYKEAEKWSKDPDVAAEKRMFHTPDLYGYFTASVTPFKRFTASLSGTYTGAMLVQHRVSTHTSQDIAVETPDFFDMNLKLAYEIPLVKDLKLEVHAGVQNIFDAYQSDFDAGKDRDSGYVYGPATPRSWFAGLKIRF